MTRYELNNRINKYVTINSAIKIRQEHYQSIYFYQFYQQNKEEDDKS